MTTHAVPRPATAGRARAAWAWRDRVVAAGALGMAALVGLDGTPAWQVARAVLVAAVAVAVDAGLRRGGARGALGAVAAGTVATGTGAGIAVPHLTTSGLSVPATAGAAAAVAGVVLVVLGTRAAASFVHGWWRLAAIPVLATVLGAAGIVGVAVAATNVPREPLGRETLADRGIPYTDVALATGDGVRLAAWYAPPANGAAVVVLHGAGSTRTSVLDQAVVLVESGYGVLLVDARGHDLSGGRAMDFGWFGDRDVAAAVDFLVDRPEVDPGRVAVLGLSMGGEEAIGAAAADARIAAVVAEGAIGRTAADHDWLSDVYGARGWVQERIDGVLYGLTDLLTSAGPPPDLRQAAATAGRPMLLITGGSVPDEANAASWIRAGSRDTVTTWEVPGAGHTDGLSTAPQEWRQRVTAFLAAALDLEEEP